MELEEAKTYLRVEHNEDDELIKQLIKIATETTYQYLNRDKEWKAPEPVTGAIYLIVADLYENRAYQFNFNMNSNKLIDRLLNPYRLISI